MFPAVPYNVTKLDAAERKLVAAVRGFFNNEDSIVVYSLAGDTAEVLDALCRKQGLKGWRDHAVESVPNLTHKKIAEMINMNRNFFKHARGSNVDTVLKDFSDARNDTILYIASLDLVQVATKLRRILPVEAFVYMMWYTYAYFDTAELAQSLPGFKEIPPMFPNLKGRPRYEQKVMGREAIAWAKNEPAMNRIVPDEEKPTIAAGPATSHDA